MKTENSILFILIIGLVITNIYVIKQLNDLSNLIEPEITTANGLMAQAQTVINQIKNI